MDKEIHFLRSFQVTASKTRFTNQLVDALKENLDLFYPDDAHEICNDRTFISVSQMTAKRPKFGHGEENKLFSKFESKEALIEIITASCLVPFWAGYKPIKIDGKSYYDGGFTDNLPDLYPEQTLRVQPFSTGQIYAEISPSAPRKQLQMNLKHNLTLYLTGNVH